METNIETYSKKWWWVLIDKHELSEYDRELRLSTRNGNALYGATPTPTHQLLFWQLGHENLGVSSILEN